MPGYKHFRKRVAVPPHLAPPFPSPLALFPHSPPPLCHRGMNRPVLEPAACQPGYTDNPGPIQSREGELKEGARGDLAPSGNGGAIALVFVRWDGRHWRRKRPRCAGAPAGHFALPKWNFGRVEVSRSCIHRSHPMPGLEWFPLDGGTGGLGWVNRLEACGYVVKSKPDCGMVLVNFCVAVTLSNNGKMAERSKAPG